MSEQKRKLLAKGLAELFPSKVPSGPCACIDNCDQLGCIQNWEMLLANPDRLERLLRVGMAVAREEEYIKGGQ